MYCRPCILLLLLLLYWCQVMQVLFACFPLDNHKNRCYLFHGSGLWRLTRHPCPPKGMEVDNEHPGRTKSNICHRSVVDHSQFHGVRLDIPADKHICHKVCCELCQLVHRDMHYTKSRDKQNLSSGQLLQQILHGVSLSWLFLATDITFICQECAASPTKTSGT